VNDTARKAGQQALLWADRYKSYFKAIGQMYVLKLSG